MKQKIYRISAVLGLSSLLLSGCYENDQVTKSIDPPPIEVQKSYEKPVDTQSEVKKNGMELYFLSDKGYVVPYTLNMPSTKEIAKEMMKYMVKDGPGETLLPKGFSCLLPKGTQVKGLDIQNGTATIDFSKEFLRYKPEMEEKITTALTWSLTGFPSIEQVNIRVEGRNLAEMPQKKTIASGLSRDQGINVELAEGVNITQSMPVTLYFVGQNEDNITYHVPITRMVNYQKNLAQTTMTELIKGPQQSSDLVGPIDSSVQINQAQVKGKTATVDFNKELLQYESKKAVSKDAMMAIVFSLTENTTAQNVEVTVDGTHISVTGDKPSAQKSVARPKHVNPSKL